MSTYSTTATLNNNNVSQHTAQAGLSQMPMHANTTAAHTFVVDGCEGENDHIVDDADEDDNQEDGADESFNDADNLIRQRPGDARVSIRQDGRRHASARGALGVR